MRIAIVAPHIFMHREIMPKVIFSPGFCVLNLIHDLRDQGHEVTFYSANYPVKGVKNEVADLSFFKKELKLRGYDYIELLKKHPLTFITLARQVQAELISKTYEAGNQKEFDLIHVYMNEEELALAFANHSEIPVVFTHHEPFNFLPKYRSAFTKYRHLPWISISYSQRKNLPKDTNFVGNVYHGLPKDYYQYKAKPSGGYFLYMGRIVEPKGVHLAIQAAIKVGVRLKIVGKHYAGSGKDTYWEEKIKPYIKLKVKSIKSKVKERVFEEPGGIEYLGFINKKREKEKLLCNAKALLMPSTWDEPFGLIMIEALACGTPIIGLDNGAIPEIVEDGVAGIIIKTGNSDKIQNKKKIINKIAQAISQIDQITRKNCRLSFEKNFTINQMGKEHLRIYKDLISSY